jgi:hypothetical protein
VPYVKILIRALSLRETNKTILGKLYFFSFQNAAVGGTKAEAVVNGARFARLAQAKP